jgi:hypothetical protein
MHTWICGTHDPRRWDAILLNEALTQVRGDLSNPQVKAGKEGAFKESVEWFMEHL